MDAVQLHFSTDAHIQLFQLQTTGREFLTALRSDEDSR